MGFVDTAIEEGARLAFKSEAGKAAMLAGERMVADVFKMPASKSGLEIIQYEAASGIHEPAYHSIGDAMVSSTRQSANIESPRKLANSLKYPAGFLDDAKYLDVSPHFTVLDLPSDGARIKPADQVVLNIEGQRLTGEVHSIKPRLDRDSGEPVSVSSNTKVEANKIAIVKVRPTQTNLSKLDLTIVEPLDYVGKSWRTPQGFIFEAPKDVNFEKPDTSKFKILSDRMAVDLEKVVYIDGARRLSTDVKGYVNANGALISENAGNPERLLLAFSSAPRFVFSDAPFTNFKNSSIFNPAGDSENCMACTAAVLRTLQTGHVTTAGDIAKIAGDPTRGSFKNEHEAWDWFGKAANVKRPGITFSNPADLKADTNYAVTVILNSAEGGNNQHMVFARRLTNRMTVIYDGQSGLRLTPKSLSRSDKLSTFFHELEFVK